MVATMRTESIAATPRAGEITRDGVIGVNEARRRAAAALEALEPPDEARPEHLALSSSLTQLVEAVDVFLASTGDLDTEGFADAVATAGDLQSLSQAVGRACQVMSNRAIDLGVEADIRC